MEKIKLYIQEAYDELVNKVTWPTGAELQESSVVVMITSIIISLLVVLMDVGFRYGTGAIYKLIIH